jgi:hypothetical protein
MESDFLDFLRMGLKIQRISWQKAFQLKEQIEHLAHQLWSESERG